MIPSSIAIAKTSRYVCSDLVCDSGIIEKEIFENVAKILDDKYDVRDKDILEIGCNDGVLLKPLCDLGAKAVGIDPATNVVKVAREKGLNVHNGYFSYDNHKLFLAQVVRIEVRERTKMVQVS